MHMHVAVQFTACIRKDGGEKHDVDVHFVLRLLCAKVSNLDMATINRL